MSTEIPCVYIHPNAPADIKKLFNENFADMPRVSATYIEGITGGFTDEGPATADYAAVCIDEKGDIRLFPFESQMPWRKKADEADDDLPKEPKP